MTSIASATFQHLARFSLRWSVVALVGGLSLLLAPAVLADRGIERDFDVEAGGQLTVEAAGANVEVVSVPGSRASASLTRGNDSAEKIEDDYDVEMSESGGDLLIRVERRKNWSLLKRVTRHTALDLAIEVPTVYDLDIKSSGGDISIDQIEGEVKARTSGGSLSIDNVNGDVWARTSGGSIDVRAVTGDVDSATSGGRIEVDSVEGLVHAETSGGSIQIGTVRGPLEARTSGGSIEIRQAHESIVATTSGGGVRAHMLGQPTGDSLLSSSGGSVTLYIDPSVSVDLDASSSGGSVTSDLPVRVSNFTSTKSKLHGQLNDGGPTLKLRSSGGGIKIRKE